MANESLHKLGAPRRDRKITQSHRRTSAGFYGSCRETLITCLTFVRFTTVSVALDSTQLPDRPGAERILRAAAERFVEAGYSATTLRQIADGVGIKAGSLYHHFDSKDALFAAVLERGIDVMIEAFDAVADTPAGDVVAEPRLGAHVRAHLGALFEHGPFTAVHVRAFFGAPEAVRRRAVEWRDAYERRWDLLLAELLPAVDSEKRQLLRLTLFGAMNSTIEWFDLAGTSDLDDLAALITDQFLHGVRP